MKIEELKKIIKEEIQSVLKEASIPANIMQFAKKTGPEAVTLLKKVAGWAQKSGKSIVGGTAIGKYYSTLILDLSHHGSEIRIDLDEYTVTVYDTPVTDAKSFAAALQKKG